MSYLNRSGDSNDTAHYLAKYHQEAQRCIDNASITEVTFASYIVAVYSLVGGWSINFVLQSCHNFCKSIVGLTKFRMLNDSWLELLWQHVLSSLYYVLRDSSLFGNPVSQEEVVKALELAQKLLQTAECLLPSATDISDLPLSMTTEMICLKIVSLSIFLQFYLDQFLFRASYNANFDGLKILKNCLCSVLDRINRLIAHLSPIGDYIYHAYPRNDTFGSTIYDDTPHVFLHFPNVQPRGLKVASKAEERDTALALLYAFARLLRNMLEPTADVNETTISEIHDSAITICRLCVSFPDQSPMVTLLAKRSLFWAGLVLTESRFSAGTLLMLSTY